MYPIVVPTTLSWASCSVRPCLCVCVFVFRTRDTATFVWEPRGCAGEWPAAEMLSQFPEPPTSLRAVRHRSYSAHLHGDAHPADCLLSSAAW